MKKSSLIVLSIFATLLMACGSDISYKTDNNYEQVELPDNSLIYLNQNSEITYETSFNPRIINLTGEAFFSVTKGDDTFIVKTDKGDITVLGTEFNVNASKNDLEVEVEDGNVELKKAGKKLKKQVKKGERVVLNATDDAIITVKAEFKHKTWMNNLEKEFKKLGKVIKKHGKATGKEFNKAGKNVGKESKKIGKGVKKESKKIKNKLK